MLGVVDHLVSRGWLLSVVESGEQPVGGRDVGETLRRVPGVRHVGMGDAGQSPVGAGHRLAVATGGNAENLQGLDPGTQQGPPLLSRSHKKMGSQS